MSAPNRKATVPTVAHPKNTGADFSREAQTKKCAGLLARLNRLGVAYVLVLAPNKIEPLFVLFDEDPSPPLNLEKTDRVVTFMEVNGL